MSYTSSESLAFAFALSIAVARIAREWHKAKGIILVMDLLAILNGGLFVASLVRG